MDGINWQNFTVRLTPAERAKLQKLADESGRKPGNVLRRLLGLSDLPEARRILGLQAEQATPEPAAQP